MLHNSPALLSHTNPEGAKNTVLATKTIQADSFLMPPHIPQSHNMVCWIKVNVIYEPRHHLCLMPGMSNLCQKLIVWFFCYLVAWVFGYSLLKLPRKSPSKHQRKKWRSQSWSLLWWSHPPSLDLCSPPPQQQSLFIQIYSTSVLVWGSRSLMGCSAQTG